MTNTTRRGAIATMAAVATVAVTPAYATDDDSRLLGLTAEFQRAYADFTAAREECQSGRERFDALPDCPPSPAPAFDRAGYERFQAFWRAHGLDRLYDHTNVQHKRLKPICNAIFSTPARTARGAVEKLKIVRLAAGDHDADGDVDLACWQADSDTPWFESVIADLERIGGET